MNLATKVHQQQIHDLIQTLRYEAGLSKRITAHLRGLEKDLLGAYLNAGDITSQRKLKALLDEARAAIADRYDAAKVVYDDEIPQLAEIGANKAVAALNGAIKVDIFSMSLTKDQIEAIASDVLIQGAPSAEWWGLQEAETLRKFKNAVRGGMLRGATGDEMAREVRDLMQTSMRNAQALVRTSVITVNNAAHEAAYEANADLMEGTQWMATLDPRTCLVAGTPVSTPSGPIPIEQLKAGDLVFGGSGEARATKSTMSRRAGQTVKVTLSNGETIQCTPDHRWLRSNQEWAEAKDLKTGDALAFALK